MTVQELIDRLEQIEDKAKEVRDSEYGNEIDYIYEFETYIYL